MKSLIKISAALAAFALCVLPAKAQKFDDNCGITFSGFKPELATMTDAAATNELRPILAKAISEALQRRPTCRIVGTGSFLYEGDPKQYPAVFGTYRAAGSPGVTALNLNALRKAMQAKP